MTNNPFETIVDFYDESVNEADRKGLAEVYKQATQIVFDSLKAEASRFCKLDITITDVKYLDGYFIFGSGTNSVVHFYINETPGWKYGIWWAPVEKEESTEDNPVYETDRLHCYIFTQYEEEIDKFKPSASMVQDEFDIYLADFNDLNTSHVWNFVRDIKFIHDEPYLAFYREMHYSDFNREYVSRAQAKSYFKHYYKQKQLEIKITKRNDKALFKTIYTIFKEEFDAGNCFIEDLGECWSPRYEIIMKNSYNIVNGCYDLFDCLDDSDAEKAHLLWDKTIERCKKRADKADCIWFPCCSDSVVLIAGNAFHKRFEEVDKVGIKG